MPAPLILVVDDDPEILPVVERVLRRAGYATLAASDGESGLREATSALPSVIVSDVLMPGLNGFQLARALKADARTAHIPILLVSGKTDPADHLWASEVGARVLLRKPVEDRQLIAEIAAALASKPAPGSATGP